jgi:anionic cell wall polymer biosynthesis LytR-Cps2A-Psr (LCP) family protein
MDGETALKFVRSRHAEGEEGTDIAREARQQKVIGAIESKIMDPKVFLNPNKSIKIWNVVMDSIKTDINMESGAVIARYASKSISNVNKYLIPEELLVNPPATNKYDKQYVFIPKAGNGNWKEVNIWVKQILN